MGARVVLIGFSELEGGFGGAIVMREVLPRIRNGFFDEGIAAAEVERWDGRFGRNFFSVLHVVGPLAAQGFTCRGEQQLVFFALLDVEAGLVERSSFAQVVGLIGQVVDEVWTRQVMILDAVFMAGMFQLLLQPVIVGEVAIDVLNFFSRQLADELRQPAFGLVVFYEGDNAFLLFQPVLVVFHGGTVEDYFLLVEAVLGKE